MSIKPVAEGSSVGVFIVREDHKHPPQELTRADWAFGERVLVEPYIPGKELTCAVMGDKALGVIEIVPTVKFYDYEAKYAPGGSKHLLPAPIASAVYGEIQRLVARRPSRAWLPWRYPRRLPLRRQPVRHRRPRLPGGKHPAGHDRNLAGTGDGAVRRHQRLTNWSAGWSRTLRWTDEPPMRASTATNRLSNVIHSNFTNHLPISPKTRRLAARRALGCREVVRADFTADGGLRGTGMVSSEAGYRSMTNIMLVAELAALVGHNR